MAAFVYKGSCWSITSMDNVPIYSFQFWEYMYKRDIYSGFRIIKLT